MSDVRTIDSVFAEHNATATSTSLSPDGDSVKFCKCVNCKAHLAGETGPAKSEI